MAKIVNIKTGEVRETIVPEPKDCEVCGVKVYEQEGGIEGSIGKLPVAFCGVCMSGIVSMLIERQNK